MCFCLWTELCDLRGLKFFKIFLPQQVLEILTLMWNILSQLACILLCLFIGAVTFRFLLSHGASLCLVNCDGDVPMDIAEDEATETLLQERTLTQG